MKGSIWPLQPKHGQIKQLPEARCCYFFRCINQMVIKILLSILRLSLIQIHVWVILKGKGVWKKSIIWRILWVVLTPWFHCCFLLVLSGVWSPTAVVGETMIPRKDPRLQFERLKLPQSDLKQFPLVVISDKIYIDAGHQSPNWVKAAGYLPKLNL